MTISKEFERKLNRLEKRYDKASEPTRQYYTDLKEISDLHKGGAIDLVHAEHLSDLAKAHYESAEKARKARTDALKPKRTLTPIGVYRRPKGRPTPSIGVVVDDTYSAITSIIGFLVFLFAMSLLFL